jgi:hypothetical protein
MNQSGRIQEAYVLRLLTCVLEGLSELYFHAAMRECSRDDPLLEGYRLDEELGALIAQRIGNGSRT